VAELRGPRSRGYAFGALAGEVKYWERLLSLTKASQIESKGKHIILSTIFGPCICRTVLWCSAAVSRACSLAATSLLRAVAGQHNESCLKHALLHETRSLRASAAPRSNFARVLGSDHGIDRIMTGLLNPNNTPSNNRLVAFQADQLSCIWPIWTTQNCFEVVIRMQMVVCSLAKAL
jgi:hypothetical protein